MATIVFLVASEIIQNDVAKVITFNIVQFDTGCLLLHVWYLSHTIHYTRKKIARHS